MYFSPQKQKFIDAAIEMFGDGVIAIQKIANVVVTQKRRVNNEKEN